MHHNDFASEGNCSNSYNMYHLLRFSPESAVVAPEQFFSCWKICFYIFIDDVLSFPDILLISRIKNDKGWEANSDNFQKYWRAYWNKLQGSKLEKERDLHRRSNVHILDDTLHLSHVTDINSGDYACTVTNAAGSSTSNVLTLTVAGQYIFN